MKKYFKKFVFPLLLSFFLFVIFSTVSAQSGGKQFHGTFDIQYQNQAIQMKGFRDRVKKFLNLYKGYAFNRIMSLGDEKKLCGMLGNGGQYRVFIIDPDVSPKGAKTWTRIQTSGISSQKPEKVEASQFTAAGWKSGWTAETKKNGKLTTKNDFLLLAEIWESSGAWDSDANKEWSDQQVPWHESCHAAIYRAYGDRYDSNTEHIYIENYTEMSTGILTKYLVPLENLISSANQLTAWETGNGKKKLSREKEKEIWMPVREMWISFKGAWIKHHKNIPSNPQALKDFVSVTGVRLFTVNEVKKIYEAGYFLDKKGIKPPYWVFSDSLANETNLAVTQPVKNTTPGSKKQVYLFSFVIISPAQGNKNVPAGKINVTLEEAFNEKYSSAINYAQFDIFPKNSNAVIARNTRFGTVDITKDYDERGYRVNFNLLDPGEIRKKHTYLNLVIEYRDPSGKYESCEKKIRFPIPAPEQPAESSGGFDGLWNSNFGLVKLVVEGSSVKGGFAYKGGKIRGEISPDGRTLTGIWKQRPTYKPPKDAGKLVFVLSPDGKTIAGTWGYGESANNGKWNLTRAVSEIALINNLKNYSSGVMGPSSQAVFTINSTMNLTFIRTEHENYGKGATAGKIALREKNGAVHGPWQAKGGSSSPINTWTVTFNNYKLPPGTYTVLDSDPSTWLINTANKAGACAVYGKPGE